MAEDTWANTILWAGIVLVVTMLVGGWMQRRRMRQLGKEFEHNPKMVSRGYEPGRISEHEHPPDEHTPEKKVS